MDTRAETFLEVSSRLKGTPSEKVEKFVELFGAYARTCTDVVGEAFFENYRECADGVDGEGTVARFIVLAQEVGLEPRWRIEKFINLYTGLRND